MAPADIRVALYWAPPHDDPLTEAGNTWLGRDCEHNRPCPQPAIPGLADATEAPRHYGFHATLRPPMHLATGWPAFFDAAEALAQTIAPFDLPRLEVTELDGFLALRETAPCPALQSLANACVRATETCRLPPTDTERARRRQQTLTPLQENFLESWGYPYVMEEWRFHMTLTRRLDTAEMATLRPAASAHFAEALALPRQITDIAIFTQSAQKPFLVAERIRLFRR